MQNNLPCKKSPSTSRTAEGEWEGKTSDRWGEMRRGRELEIGGLKPRTEMVGGDF